MGKVIDLSKGSPYEQVKEAITTALLVGGGIGVLASTTSKKDPEFAIGQSFSPSKMLNTLKTKYAKPRPKVLDTDDLQNIAEAEVKRLKKAQKRLAQKQKGGFK